ncbi:MAG: RNA 2',3'-cyclic phosphodiesterase [Firmicutes bacterium]|nr:RNA 2',3'-cyclic phosphodiesterase [Bacillota bacterium]
MDKNLRLFIAVPITPRIKKRIGEVITRFKTLGADIKWVPEENLHTTLKFLGDTPIGKVDKITEALEKTLTAFETSRLRFRGIGAFPNMHNPRIIWVGSESVNSKLTAIASAIDEAMASLGFEKEEKKFKAHLTIGRVRGPKGIPELMKEIEKIKQQEIDSMKITEIHLVKSDLQRTGPIYTTIKKFPLFESSEQFSGPKRNNEEVV